MITHTLKTWPEFFEALRLGQKKAELRHDDRTPSFAVGDRLVLREYEPGRGYLGRAVEGTITHIVRDAPQFGLIPGFCLLSFKYETFRLESVPEGGSPP